MIKTKVAFLKGRLLTSQSAIYNLFKELRLAGKKPAPKKATFVLIM